LFIVFEGIDGSGKTTLSSRVAKLLRKEGLSVEHVREEGAFASRVTTGIREFTRDACNLDLTPEAEILLYAAREMQLFHEATKPAIESADLVIADRFDNAVRFVPTTSGTFFGRTMTANRIYTIAGTGTAGFSGEGGAATKAELQEPSAVVTDPHGGRETQVESLEKLVVPEMPAVIRVDRESGKSPMDMMRQRVVNVWERESRVRCFSWE